jgi:hypothetical protein
VRRSREPGGRVSITCHVGYPLAGHDLDTIDLSVLGHDLPDERAIAQGGANPPAHRGAPKPSTVM